MNDDDALRLAKAVLAWGRTDARVAAVGWTAELERKWDERKGEMMRRVPRSGRGADGQGRRDDLVDGTPRGLADEAAIEELRGLASEGGSVLADGRDRHGGEFRHHRVGESRPRQV